VPKTDSRRSLGDAVARQLANTTKTAPQYDAITPRWLVQLLSWTPVESGTFRVNKVRNDVEIAVECGARDEHKLPETFVDYVEKPREYTLNSISTIVDVHTRVSDLYSRPHDQIREQLRLAVERVKERQEGELINNADYGLRRAKVRQRRMTLTNCWRRYGKSQHSSWLIRAPSQRLAGSARGAECLRRQLRSSDHHSLHGAGCRWYRPTSWPSTKPANRTYCCCARARSGRALSGSSSRGCPESRRRGSRCASWASIASRLLLI